VRVTDMQTPEMVRETCVQSCIRTRSTLIPILPMRASQTWRAEQKHDLRDTSAGA
jgi:hypothetical protein